MKLYSDLAPKVYSRRLGFEKLRGRKFGPGYP